MIGQPPVPSPYSVLGTPEDWTPYGDAATSPQAIAPTQCGWHVGQTISDLWSYEDSSGVWVSVEGVGWKRLSPASRSGHTHMTLLAGAATHDNLPVDFHEDSDGQIDQLIV
ncbi:hypothetical protein LWC34_40850 [Kibdelosporangium philippinense]|uniref:Uncharacterized protein n=1 Tax=Kibdelosporangium philippinense TaxID=211113 RepID=A0ABS8ZMY7_9PSEU|nr:hypothetical protein [Kibdelosporangium philippinense]MCE7009119.1 hypothetical protein [Kibdelosporangium philippinense]